MLHYHDVHTYGATKHWQLCVVITRISYYLTNLLAATDNSDCNKQIHVFSDVWHIFYSVLS